VANEPAEINREQLRYVGEKTALRFFNLKDPKDLSRMEETITNNSVKAFVDDLEGMNADDIKKWLIDKRGAADLEWEVCYMVSGSMSVKPEEFGEIQGFINFYPDEPSRELLPEKYREAKQVIGIGYARYPEGRHGQISGAIRQACMEINKLKGNATMGTPDMVIVALCREDNKASIKTIEDSCFDNYGSVQVKNEEGEDEKDFLFILNWDRLNTRLHTQAESSLLNASKADV
jgi:hypothetical protein